MPISYIEINISISISNLLRELLLIQANSRPPVVLERAKQGHIERLELVRAVWWQADEADVVLVAGIQDSHRNVAGVVVSHQDFFSRQALQMRQGHIKEEQLKLHSSKPS